MLKQTPCSLTDLRFHVSFKKKKKSLPCCVALGFIRSIKVDTIMLVLIIET